MAAGATYTPIQSYTLGSNGTVTFSSIPSTYTDLIIVGANIANSSTNGISVGLQFNGDTSTTSYLNTYGGGNGTTTAAGGLTTRAWNYIGWNACPEISNKTSNFIVNIWSYANTNIYKVTSGRSNSPVGSVKATEHVIGTWKSTSAINSIKVSPDSASFAAGAMITLYGITAA